VLSPYEIPRAALDVFVAEQLSIGGSLGFASVPPPVSGKLPPLDELRNQGARRPGGREVQREV